MFETLSIQNFQAHTKLHIDFDPHITTIVGPSDAGKSAIIRALRWVCTNLPGGTAYIHHGAAGATVRLGVDGHVVARRRAEAGDVNEYHLDDNRFVAFGRTVPDAIADLINMDATGWQQQHDAPYWFAETAGEVSRQLNTIVNLGIIDDTLAAVLKTTHRARTVLEIAEANLTTAKRECDDLRWVDEAGEEWDAVEALHTTMVDADARAVLLGGTVADAVMHDTTHKTASGAARMAQAAVDAGAGAIALAGDVATLGRLVAQARDAESWAGADVPDTSMIVAAYNDYKAATTGATALEALIETIYEKEENLCQAEKALTRANGLVPTTCPTCGQSL